MTGVGLDLAGRHLWQITLLIPVVILLSRWLAKRSAHLAYAVLLVCLLKCVIPPVVTSRAGVFCWFGRGSTTVQSAEASVTETGAGPIASKPITPVEVGKNIEASTHADAIPAEIPAAEPTATIPPAAEQPEIQAAFSPNGYLVVAWLIGVVGILGYLGGKRLQLLRFHEDTEVIPSDDLLQISEDVGAQLELAKNPRLLVTAHPTIPFVSGVLSPRIVLPDGIVLNTQAEDLRFILAHEMTHLKRGDVLWGAFQLVVQALFWFHPFVWWLNREIRRVREDCCDAEVVSQLECPPGDYARCLLKVLDLQRKLRSMPELAGLKPAEVTEQRLRHIMRCGKSGPPMLTGVGWGAVLVLAILVIPGGALPGSVEASAATTVTVEPVESVETVDTGRVEPAKAPENEGPNQNTLPPVKPEAPAEVLTKAGGELLRYGVERGDRQGYSFNLQLKYPENETSWTGAVYVAETGGDVHEMNFSIDRLALTKFTHPVPGPNGRIGLIPREDHLRRMFPPTPNLPSRLRERMNQFPGQVPDIPGLVPNANAERMDRQGRHIGATETDEFPLLVGNVASLLFPRLPPKSFTTWKSEETRMERFTEPSSTPGSYPLPFEEPESFEKAVQYSVSWELLNSSDTELQYRRAVLAQTLELVDGEPEISLQMSGTLVWDRLTGSWKSLEYEGRGTERKPQLETRVPLTLQIKRQ
ncbi:MAG: M56 family metallopeptidase [Planctomycetaceae bacterium]